MFKSKLRQIYLGRQKLISPAEIIEKSREIAERFFESFDISGISFLHCFLPIGRFNEIDTKFIFERVWRDFANIVTLVPRVNFRTNELESLVFTPDTNLIQNAWQIHEPAHDNFVQVERIDVVLVPLLSFDLQGFRVGYGKGFYDKFLTNCRADCLKIGLSYFQPAEKITDAQLHDVKLDYCLTPEKVWSFV